MGRRSRKRASGETRAERDAARRARASSTAPRPPRPGRPSTDERPAPPWGNFPLSELVIFVGLVLMVWGFLSGSDGNVRIAGGLGLAALGGLELSVREHLAGFRSHTTLLAAAAAFIVVSVLALGPGPHTVWVLLLIALVVFGAVFYALRELFKRRSGGLGFR